MAGKQQGLGRDDEPVDLDGQVVAITGAGSGIGRAHALLFASRGARVVVNDLGPSSTGFGTSAMPADQVVSEIRSRGGTAIANYSDAADAQGAASIVDAAIREYGRIDVLVCNAGILTAQRFEDLGDDVWTRTLAVHLNGSMFASRAAWPHMKRQAYGRIIFTTSSAALFGREGLSAYAAAKGGVLGLMRSISQEAGTMDISVNCVVPVAVTRMTTAVTIDTLGGRSDMMDPGNISPIVVYLSSRECRANNEIYCAGGGRFARAQIVQSEGVAMHRLAPISPEDVRHHWEAINDMSRSRAITNDEFLSNMLSDAG